MLCRTIVACVLCCCLISICPAQNAKTGSLKITFKYKGKPPKPKPAKVPAAGAFCGAVPGGIKDETLIVNPMNSGIKNVIVYLYTGRRGVNLPPQKLGNQVHILANQNCMFKPHVLIAQVGDSIKVTNPDPVGHNANFAFFNNNPIAAIIPPNGNNVVKLTQPEPAVIPVECNIHPWMRAHVLILDHAFAGVSDENGVLEIKNIPARKDMVFRAWHEEGTFKNEIYIDGKKDKWKSNKFELDIKPGENDLGVVEIPATEF